MRYTTRQNNGHALMYARPLVSTQGQRGTARGRAKTCGACRRLFFTPAPLAR